MRPLAVIAFSAAALAASHVRAADLSVGYPAGAVAYGVPAAPVVIYDTDCGVTMRPYWEPPWANRHYFPATGKMPKYGRREILMPSHRILPRAESFSRSWSTSSGFADEAAPIPLNPPYPPASRRAPPSLPPAKP